MTTLLAFVVSLGLCAPASAAEVRVPGEGWSIRFDAPPLADEQERGGDGADYAYRANSERFNLSVFVETPQGAGTHEACHAFYWSKASRNPRIDPESVKTARTAKYVRVQYDLVLELAGEAIRQRNVNYFFAHKGRWVDVHASIIGYGKDDARVLAAFDKSLAYGAKDRNKSPKRR